MPISLVCAQCGDTFTVGWPSHAIQRYCTPECVWRNRTTPEKFWAQVDRASGHRVSYMESDCWLWRGATNPRGYGVVTVAGRVKAAHRHAYELTRGAIDQPCVCHHCDVPACVNPEHLFLATHKDNRSDATQKGRWKHEDCRPHHIRVGHVRLFDLDDRPISRRAVAKYLALTQSFYRWHFDQRHPSR